MDKLVKTEEEKISRINAAGLINSNLENLWKDVSNAMCSGKHLLWNKKLDAIWLILGGDVFSKKKKDGKKDETVSDFNKLDKEVYSLGSLSCPASGFNTPTKEQNENLAKQYLNLREKSLFLRKLQNKQGKGTAYRSDDEDDL